MMKIKVVVAMLIQAGMAGAMLFSVAGTSIASAEPNPLVEECWDYWIDTAVEDCNGGTGFVSTAWVPNNTDAVLTNGLTFGKMAVRGNALNLSLETNADGSFTSSPLERTLNISGIHSGNLWMAYLIQFDVGRSTFPNDEKLEIRPNLSIRNGINEDDSSALLRYGADATTSDVDELIKSGETLLFIFKYADLGNSSGGSATGWVLTDSDYNSVVSDGITEEELSEKAAITVSTNSFSSITLGGSASFQLVPMGRNNSTPSFIVDEVRMGTNLADVVAGEYSEGATISEVLGSELFDPWNTNKWDAWYDNSGHIIKSFIIDTDVTFSNIPGGIWSPVLSGPTHLFEVFNNLSYEIDGDELCIDVCKSSVPANVADYYAASRSGADPLLNRYEDWVPWTCFYVDQPSTTITAGVVLKNFDINGFSFGFETAHSHKRRLTVTNCYFYRNVWAIYARGKNVTCVSNTVAESFSGGVYCEYNSTNWVFIGNSFHDNQVNDMAQSFGDLVLDSCHNYLIASNTFGPASVTNVPRHHTAVSMFRNAGENLDIREHAVHDIIIQDNTFDSYHLAVDIGARMGVVDEKDCSLEGRCYVYDIDVEQNTFTNCAVGIKVNSERNLLAQNIFSDDCEKDIVLHCVFYKNINNLISQTNGYGADVWLWSEAEDFENYADYCFYQKDGANKVHESITDDDKLFHVDIDGSVLVHLPARDPGEPDFNAQVITNADLVSGSDLQDMVNSGATPIDIAVADYAAHIPGDEVAVIWDEPVSLLNDSNEVSTAYYTIIIYDQWGLELDRCGRSTNKWARIAGGNMLKGMGFIREHSEAEIAAIPDAAEDGKFPVYIFRRGFALDPYYIDEERVVKMLPDNTLDWADITVGNFTTNGDDYAEIALVSTNSEAIYFYKPSDLTWSNQTTGLERSLHLISAGDFDVSNDVDEVAGTYPLSAAWNNYPVDLFYVGSATGAYVSNWMANVSFSWGGLTAGNFDPSDDADEVAVASPQRYNGGAYRIAIYDPADRLIENFLSPIMEVPAAALDAGRITAGIYASCEQAIDKNEQPIPYSIDPDRDYIAVLPSAPQAHSIPLFWTDVDSQKNMFWRTVPLYR